LGFKPEALDGKHHKLRVKLADAVKNQHKFSAKSGLEFGVCLSALPGDDEGGKGYEASASYRDPCSANLGFRASHRS
jgi:hypothetical protein